MKILTFLLGRGLLALALPLAAGRAPAQSLSFDRVVACAGGLNDYGWGPQNMALDAQGNTYVTGSFTGVVQLGAATLTALSSSDVFVAKLDAAGNYLWAVQTGDGQRPGSSGLAFDGAGDVYISGFFSGFSQRFGAGGPTLFNSSANSEAFVAKLSGATGQWLWARRAGGVGSDGARTLAVNAANDVYVVGDAGGAADFGPFSVAPAAGFLAKISAQGTWLWVRELGPDVGVSSLLLDAQGALYLAGAFRTTARFGATTLSTLPVLGTSLYSRQGVDLFVAKTTDAGAWLWAVQGNAVTRQNIIQGANLAFDGAGALYVAGGYGNNAVRIGNTVLPNLSSVRPSGPESPVSYPNDYYSDAYVARLDAATGAWGWAVRSGGPDSEGANCVAADAQGRVYAAGAFTTASVAYNSPQLAQLDGATGAWRLVQSLGTQTWVNRMQTDGLGRLHLAGFFNGASATFGALTLPGLGAGRSTGYLARAGAGPLAAAPAAPVPAPGLQVWPNPRRGGPVWVQGLRPGQAVQVFDVRGARVGGGTMPAAGPLPLALPPALPAGLYLVRGAGQARRLVIE